MPRGIYKRKKKAGAGSTARTRAAGKGIPKILAQMRAEKMRCEDRVVALGTAIEALEALDE